MKKLVVAFLFLFVLLFVSCNEARIPPKESDSIKVTTPVSYGNGVYYFYCNEKGFGVSLSTFISEIRNDWEIKSMCGDGTGAYGRDIGYFVVIGKK